MSVTPTSYPLIPKMKRETIISVLETGKRIDGRALDEVRKITIVPNYIEKSDGSALVYLGDTLVLVGVKVEPGAPYPDNPNEGVLMVNAEFVPLASPAFEPGPPDENAYELARIIDRSYRESKAIGLGELALVPGQKVLVVWNDIYVLNHSGNLIDASAIASLVALMNTRIPVYEEADGGNFVKKENEYKGNLNVKKKIITATIAKIGNYYLADPTDEEEYVSDARLSVSFTEDGIIAGMQKMGIGYLDENDINQMIDLAWKTAKIYLGEISKLI
ncbi:exosome complex protein Rrp42 [Fervidicoccus fontis]|jgi:exosome complex component RRP42|uniref:Exosome complex component Rrp42 n=2 Tax=Fervidicoccus fontis TaxID=683846 RepID=I0A2X0_FERFK|nr:exosome complex protein Rrp42 [Fervidicoccus fontis]AFH43327.1 exosome complex RNA-binding protein Rrp42 [Fervidicoccus fontis Kam940]MBE9390703.1 exosome complex protein Rrp42 [Fervidicoccus fontis]PMB76412.1 MAG: ribonuclease PH [Fervidicoccus fontis]